MSRIGRNPIMLPQGVTVKYDNGLITVVGPKGTLSREVNTRLDYEISESEVKVINNHPFSDKTMRAMHGLFRQLVANMIEGVSKGFEKRLVINGVGYRINLKSPSEAVLSLGFSHPVEISAPEGVIMEAERNTLIIKGIDKEKVGQFASKIKGIKPVEPYHGYGIAYHDQVIRRKESKTGKK